MNGWDRSRGRGCECRNTHTVAVGRSGHAGTDGGIVMSSGPYAGTDNVPRRPFVSVQLITCLGKSSSIQVQMQQNNVSPPVQTVADPVHGRTMLVCCCCLQHADSKREVGSSDDACNRKRKEENRINQRGRATRGSCPICQFAESVYN